MADVRQRKASEGNEDRSSGSENTHSTQKKMPQKETSGASCDSEERLEPDSHDAWNSMSYWYYMQSYYQYYYNVCYFYTFYYWQLVASQNNHSGTTIGTSTAPQSTGFSSQYQTQQQNFRQNQQNRQAGFPWFRTQQSQQTTGCEVRVSSLQKRIMAELMDFLFLYFTKFLVFSIFYNNMERFTQLQYSLIIDESTSLKDLEEILIQALVYRLMVFCYETFFIVGGFFGSMGGATPGKYLMGLSVVSADNVELLASDARGEKVGIMPGGNPGWWRACVRALVKNISMTFLFPIFITVFFFQHNRTIYDIIAGTVVVDNVETWPPQQQRQQ